MKQKILLITVVAVCFVLFTSSMVYHRKNHVPNEPTVRKNCTGYEIIEAGKGIDCYGDTIKLMNKHGFYEVASRYQETTDALN